jgi:two-component system chemotaxis response regulator CheB
MAIRVLLVDDSVVVRVLLRSIFEKDDAFEVMGEAGNGAEAVAQVRRERPGLITMDLEMPLMGGVDAIEEIMSFCPVPILVVSDYVNAQHAYAAVVHGAVDVVAKPGLSESEIAAFLAHARLVASIPVITHIKSLRRNAPKTKPVTAPVPLGVALLKSAPVFGLASSTGGPQALCRVLSQLPANFNCPILIAQHVIPGFAAGMAKWLATESALPVKLAEQGEPVVPGQVYLSPSEAHLRAVFGNRIDLQVLREGDTYRPSCDVLLDSMATVFGKRSVGVILTGMGSDGAKGLASIRAAGGTTLAQDEASSVIFGMNRVAIERGVVGRVLSLDEIAGAMVQLARAAGGP